MYAHQDTKFSGVWHNCHHCAWAGDTIELAAKVWDLSLSGALDRILSSRYQQVRANRTDAALSGYVTRHHRRQAVGAILQAARYRTSEVGNSCHRDALSKLVDYDPHDVDWGNRFGRIVRLVTDEEMQEIAPHYVPSRQDVSHVVFPVEDLPRRLAGVFVLQTTFGRSTVQQDSVLHDLHGGEDPYGLLMADLIHSKEPGLTHPVIGMAFLWSLRAHGYQIRTGGSHLPLVVPVGKQVPASCIRAFFAQTVRPIIIGNAPTDLATMRLAIQTNYPISQLPSDPYRVTVAAAIQRRIGDAQDWRDFANNHIPRLPRVEGEAYLASLALPDNERQSLIDALPPLSRSQLAHLLAPRRQANVRNKVIEEDEDGWRRVDNGERILNARVVVQRVLHREKRTAYEGVIHFQGHTIPFNSSQREVEHGFVWVRRILLEHQLGPLVGSPNWSRSCLDIAQLLHPPVYQALVDRVGWDPTKPGFVFPNGTLYADGSWGDGLLSKIGYFPCERWHNCDLHVLAVARLSAAENPCIAAFWALLIQVVECAIAPIFGVPAPCLAVSGSLAELALRRTISALGCHIVSTQVSLERMLSGIRNMLQSHDWPIAIPLDHIRLTTSQLAKQLDANAIIAIPVGAAEMLLSRPRWSVLNCDAPYLGTIAEAEPYLDTILPAYLRQLLLDRTALPDFGNNPTHAIAQHLSRWFTEAGGNAEAILQGRDLICNHTTASPIKLARILQALCRPAGLHWDTETHEPTALHRTESAVLLDQHAIPAATTALAWPAVDAEWLWQAFRQIGATYERGWHIPIEWWVDQGLPLQEATHVRSERSDGRREDPIRHPSGMGSVLGPR
jgi:hypothetical protein